MATDLNRIVIIGRLTKDPELRSTSAGTSVCSFSIANNRTYVTGGEKKEQVSFFNCVAWAKTGEVIAEYVKKGQRIAIEGRIQQRSWDDQEGNKRYTVEIVIDNFQFLTSKGGGADASMGGGPGYQSQSPSQSASQPSAPNSGRDHFSDDDIPF